MFLTPIVIAEHPQINDWLGLLEKEMRLTLATLLSEAVAGVKGFKEGGKFDRNKYMDWISKYQVILLWVF